MCKYCNRKPVFDSTGHYELWSNKETVATGSYSSLAIGVDASGKLIMIGGGDDDTEPYYPKYCPECGRKLIKAHEGENMDFRQAWFRMLNGKKIKLPEWSGYWAWENNTIMMHCSDGQVLDIRETDNVSYTFSNIAEKTWMVVDNADSCSAMIRKIQLILVEEGQKDPKFKLSELIKYTPSEVAGILRRHIKELTA